MNSSVIWLIGITRRGTLRAYGYDLLAFCRWLDSVDIGLELVTTETVLDFMRYCRQCPIAGRPANVVSMTGAALDHYCPSTINHRLAVLTGLFTFCTLREPELRSPIPSGREVRRVSAEKRNGLLGHLVRPKRRSALRLREPRRLPRALNRRETADLLSSLRTWRDRSLAGLMLLSGLRSGELLTLNLTDVSYLPDLHAYLDDLLRTRERLLATTDLDQWARTEAMPSQEEIRRIRRLIDQISQDLDELEPQQRQQLQQAVSIARQHRSVTLGMPRTRQTLPDLRPERTP